MHFLLSQPSLDNIIVNWHSNQKIYKRVWRTLEQVYLLCYICGKLILKFSQQLWKLFITFNFINLPTLDQYISWTSISELPTRAVSTASIVLTIEAEQECERTPLLAAQCRGAYRTQAASTKNFRKNYGGFVDDRTEHHFTAELSDFLISNKVNDRRRNSAVGSVYSSSSISSNTSTYFYEKKTHLCDVRLFAIMFVLITGFTIATYLLITETSLPSSGFVLDIVSHDIWSKFKISSTALLNSSNVVNVLVLHTGSESCDNPLSCSRVLSQLQKKYFAAQHLYELPYNFLVADDGQTYEARGWNHLSGFATNIPQDTSIVIGFLGNYTKITPNTIPLQSALSLLKESVRRKKLQQNYRIIGIRNVTAHDNDAEALFHLITNWPHFERIINVF